MQAQLHDDNMQNTNTAMRQTFVQKLEAFLYKVTRNDLKRFSSFYTNAFLT